jgi:hypothetical protein
VTSGGAGASASVPLCVEPGCPNPRLTVMRDGERWGISAWCMEHTLVFSGDEDELELDSSKLVVSVNPAVVFREEVRRRRLERESRS